MNESFLSAMKPLKNGDSYLKNENSKISISIIDTINTISVDNKNNKNNKNSKISKKRKLNYNFDKKSFNSRHKTLTPIHSIRYYFKNNLRYVVPYHCEMNFNIKKYQSGKELIHLLTQCYIHPFSNFYEYLLENGKIYINSEQITNGKRILKLNEIIKLKMHRHEPPVSAKKIEIIYHQNFINKFIFNYNDKNLNKNFAIWDEILIVNKPAGIPVHSCGQFVYNCVLKILQNEYNFDQLYVVHRLDRVTSGLLFFGKTKNATKYLNSFFQKTPESQTINDKQNDSQNDNRNGNIGVIRAENNNDNQNIQNENDINESIKKVYLARVEGKFPETEIIVNTSIPVSHKGNQIATTKFKLRHYNGHSSVIECIPIQGRMHQIRLHLKQIKHPILNDAQYNTEKVHFLSNTYVDTEGMKRHDELQNDSTKKVIAVSDSECSINTHLPCDYEVSNQVLTYDYEPSCAVCNAKKSISIFGKRRFCYYIYLHCWKYTIDGIEFETPIPEWAKENYDSSKSCQSPFMQMAYEKSKHSQFYAFDEFN